MPTVPTQAVTSSSGLAVLPGHLHMQSIYEEAIE